ncbi:lysozyme [Leptolyngbya sp. PCC 6406]|uniref:lysozyme n=1 Tax=Leptolyngbya sp. PCC 6406 TaxID=1173264 RepID=UPI0002AC521B|nr:lysozyme [Leptolyngbya sp. PCC 6406]
MGTWIKETDTAIYLMQGGYWISRITKYPSKTNPKEKVVNISGMKAWFTRSDAPQAMTVAYDNGPEPPALPPPPPAPPTPVQSMPNTTLPTPSTETSATGAINAAGLKLIKTFEGRELRAYQDSVKVWTIGYGHTSMAGPPEVTPNMTITAEQAEEILKQDLRKFEQGIRDRVSVTLDSNQFSALVSFAFNVGLGAFQNSTMRRLLNSRDYNGAANEFPRWVKAGGQTLQGLVRRRNAERALFLGQNYSQFL